MSSHGLWLIQEVLTWSIRSPGSAPKWSTLTFWQWVFICLCGSWVTHDNTRTDLTFAVSDVPSFAGNGQWQQNGSMQPKWTDRLWPTTSHGCTRRAFLIVWTKWLLEMDTKNGTCDTKKNLERKCCIYTNSGKTWPASTEGHTFVSGGMWRAWFTGKPWNAISPLTFNCTANNCNVQLKQLYKNVQN